MTTSTAHKEVVLKLIGKAIGLIPSTRPADLPVTDLIPDVPAWHGFEHDLWSIGEEVRNLLNQKTSLRKDKELYASLLEIVQNRCGMRGRQSWVLLFAYKPCAAWAKEIASLLPDSDIEGHVISALNKMKASGFAKEISPYQKSEVPWIRKEAKRYLQTD